MPLGINCLLNDTSAVADIKNVIQVFAAERLDAGKPASFPTVYKALRSEGIEIDAESAGTLYNELFNSYSDSRISTPSEVLKFTGMDVENHIKEIVKDVMGETNTPAQQQIGFKAPEIAIPHLLASVFEQAEKETAGAEKSDMLKMQGLIIKAARAMLPKNNKSSGTTLTSALQDFFNTEKVSFQTLSGGANTLRTLFSTVKNEMDNMLDEITSKLPDEEAELFREKWDKYMKTFRDSAYGIMLGRSEQNKLLKDALRQVKIDGVPLVDFNGNVKWDALIEHDNPREVSDSIAKLFRDGIKESDGTVVTFSLDQARRIGDYFEGIYRDKLAQKKQQKLNNNRSSNTSAKNLVSDFIKDLGFFKLVKDKNGKLLLSAADWKPALESMRSASGDGLDLPIQKLRDFMADRTDKDGNHYTEEQINIVVNAFEESAAVKMLPATATPTAMDRLMALHNLNGGKAFDESTQHALASLVGVSALSQSTMNNVRALAVAAQNIVNAGNLVSSSTSPNPMLNSGAYAYQMLSQIDRRIKELLRAHKTAGSKTKMALKYLADVLITAANTKLFNPGNIGENILTGLATNPAESLALLINSPELSGFLKTAQGDFWTAWASHASGGVANEIAADEDLSIDIRSGERFRGNSLANELKGVRSIGAAAKVIFKTPQYLFSVANRVVMNSFDTGFNSSLLGKSVAQSMYRALAEISTPQQAMDEMKKVLNVTPQTMAAIDQINDNIKTIMVSAGLSPTAADMALNKREMLFSLFEQAFVNVDPNIGAKRASEIVKALVEGSSNKARVLGGKKQMPASNWNVFAMVPYWISQGATFPQRALYSGMQKSEEQGNLRGAAFQQLGGALSQVTLGLFVGGAAKFAALAATATPLGFVHAADFAMQARTLRDKNNANDVTSADPGDIRKYAELHGLIRSSVTRAALGTFVMGIAAAVMFGGDDDDKKDDIAANLMRTQSGRRLLQKFGPFGVVLLSMMAYDSFDKKGKKINKSAATLEFLANTMLHVDTQENFFFQKLKNSKSSEETYKVIFGEFNDNVLPSYNMNQVEQFTRFGTTVQSGFDRKMVGQVKRQEGIASGIYKDAKDYGDMWLRNSATDVFLRWFDKKEEVNRFDKK